MRKNILFGVLGLAVGLTIGFFVANSINRSAVSQQNLAQNAANPAFMNVGQNPQTVQGMMPDVQETLDKANNEPENFEAQMKAGDMYGQIRRFDEAIKFYEQANKINPEDFSANVKLGNAYLDSGQYEQAEKWYLKALEKKDDLNARTDLGITFIERENPDYDRAIKEFQTSLTKDPNHEPTIYNLGVAYYKKGDRAEAEKVLKQLEEKFPQSDLTERFKKILAGN